MIDPELKRCLIEMVQEDLQHYCTYLVKSYDFWDDNVNEGRYTEDDIEWINDNLIVEVKVEEKY